MISTFHWLMERLDFSWVMERLSSLLFYAVDLLISCLWYYLFILLVDVNLVVVVIDMRIEVVIIFLFPTKLFSEFIFNVRLHMFRSTFDTLGSMFKHFPCLSANTVRIIYVVICNNFSYGISY